MAMTREDILEILIPLQGTRFVDAAGILEQLVQHVDVAITVSARLVPGRELLDIYRGRRDYDRVRGVQTPGVTELVNLFNEFPGSAWKLISIARGNGEGGAIFLSATGDGVGCMASRPGRLRTQP
jgi:hypothetical protein